jgi:hypothetical protein
MAFFYLSDMVSKRGTEVEDQRKTSCMLDNGAEIGDTCEALESL